MLGICAGGAGEPAFLPRPQYDQTQLIKNISIKSTDLPLAAHPILQHLELPPANASQNIAHAAPRNITGLMLPTKLS